MSDHMGAPRAARAGDAEAGGGEVDKRAEYEERARARDVAELVAHIEGRGGYTQRAHEALGRLARLARDGVNARAQADRVAALDSRVREMEQEVKEARDGWRMAAQRGEEWVREIAELREKLATNARLTVEAINAADAARAAAERSEASRRDAYIAGYRESFHHVHNGMGPHALAAHIGGLADAYIADAARAATEAPASPVGGA